MEHEELVTVARERIARHGVKLGPHDDVAWIIAVLIQRGWVCPPGEEGYARKQYGPGTLFASSRHHGATPEVAMTLVLVDALEEDERRQRLGFGPLISRELLAARARLS